MDAYWKFPRTSFLFFFFLSPFLVSILRSVFLAFLKWWLIFCIEDCQAHRGWSYLPAIPAPRKLRQEDGKSESSIGYTVRLFKKQKNWNSGGTIASLSACCYLSFVANFISRHCLLHNPSLVSALSVPSSAEVARPSGAPSLWLLPLAAHARAHLCKYSFCLHFFLFSFFPLKFQPLTFFS